jgi:branched-chain amino acid aminotransferase
MLLTINGERRRPEEATVSVFDRGFLFGDAIYEVIRTTGGRPFHLDGHLDRLERSGAAIGLDVPRLRPQLTEEIQGLLAELGACREREAYIRIMITTGSSQGMDLLGTESEPLRIVLVRPLAQVDPQHLARGIRIRLVEPDDVVARVSPGVKSNNRQANVMAHRIARDEGFDDALFVHPGGTITEGPTWNVFCVRQGEVTTPPLERGILEGITRGLVLRLCRELEIPAREGLITREEARTSDELFITSTTRGVVPVGQLDERDLRPVPGPVTARVQGALNELMEREAQETP